jgi:ketopantoate reductase
VRFLARPRIVSALTSHGLRITDLEGRDRYLMPPADQRDGDPAILADAGVILVTVKSGATEEMAQEITRFARKYAAVISLQNGVGNAAVIANILGAAGRSMPAWFRSTWCWTRLRGNRCARTAPPMETLSSTSSAADIASRLSCEGLQIGLSADMASFCGASCCST